jgi:thioredoxin 1
MAVITVTDETFKETVLTSERPVIVDFWAEWCRPCKVIAPVLAQLAQDNPDTITVAKLDIDANPKTTLEYGVMSAPTLLVFSGGEVVRSLVGARSRSKLLSDLDGVI